MIEEKWVVEWGLWWWWWCYWLAHGGRWWRRCCAHWTDGSEHGLGLQLLSPLSSSLLSSWQPPHLPSSPLSSSLPPSSSESSPEDQQTFGWFQGIVGLSTYSLRLYKNWGLTSLDVLNMVTMLQWLSHPLDFLVDEHLWVKESRNTFIPSFVCTHPRKMHYSR